MNVDRLMSDIDTLMPTLLNHRTASSSNSVSTGPLSARPNVMPARSFFLAQQAKRTAEEESSSEVKVSWVDDSTEAERLRQHQLHNLNEMTQLDEDYSHFY
jgi:hypothetical protein